MFALRDFQYRDQATGQDVQVKQGQSVDGQVLAQHRCNVEKLERTKFVASAETPSTGYKKRSKRRK